MAKFARFVRQRPARTAKFACFVRQRPEGATSFQPRASERSDATPWVRTIHPRYAPGGGKSSDRKASVIAFAPSGGASFALCANPGCRVASLACPGLGAYNPFGVFVERLKSTNRAGLWASPPFGVFVERLHALFERLQSALRRPVVGGQGRPTLPCGRCWPSGWFSGKGA